MDYEELQLTAALAKWQHGEPLSTIDMGRIIGLMEGGKLGMDVPTQEQIAGLKNRLIATLDGWSSGIKQ